MAHVWQVDPIPDGKLPTLLAHSTLDADTKNAIASGARAFPPYAQIPLTPERRLLHEVITQLVTERRLLTDINQPYEKQLAIATQAALLTPGYREMLAAGETDPAKVTALLDNLGLGKLSRAPNPDRVTMLMALAGPATGKSGLLADLAAAESSIYLNAAIVNSDDYKLLLASEAEYGQGYANAAHAESALLSDEILHRLAEKIEAGRAPNVVLDVVTLSDQRMDLVRKSGSLIVTAGTVSPEIALERSYQRGEETGRRVPTSAVLAGARSSAQTLPKIFDHPHLQFELFDTDVPRSQNPTRAALFVGSDKTLVVYRPDTFLDFVQHGQLNPNARAPNELYSAEASKPQAMAQALKAYTDQGISLMFYNQDGQLSLALTPDRATELRPLETRRGTSFVAELIDASRHLADNVEHAKSVTAQLHAPHAGAIGAGAGAAISAAGLYNDLTGSDSRLHRDVEAGGTQAALGSARVTTQAVDVVVAAAAVTESTYRSVSRGGQAVAGVAPRLAEMGPAMKLAGRVAVPLAVTAGVLEAGAGIAERNPERVAGAVGGTGGGLLGGIVVGAGAGAAWGAIGGSETGPGALVTTGLGALAGAVWGGFVGEKKAKEYLTGAIDKAMRLFEPEPLPPSAVPALSPEMTRALQMAGLAGVKPLKCDPVYTSDLGELAASLRADTSPAAKRHHSR